MQQQDKRHMLASGAEDAADHDNVVVVVLVGSRRCAVSTTRINGRRTVVRY